MPPILPGLAFLLGFENACGQRPVKSWKGQECPLRSSCDYLPGVAIGVVAMAKKRKLVEEALPLLSAAFFCEKILIESSGRPQADLVPSIIRIVDIVNLPSAQNAPQPGTFFSLPLSFFIMIKAGDARGERELMVRQVNPSGQAADAGMWKFGLQDYPEGSSVLQTNHVPIKWDKEGTYWFELLLGDRLLTRIPLVITITQQDGTAQTPAP